MLSRHERAKWPVVQKPKRVFLLAARVFWPNASGVLPPHELPHNFSWGIEESQRDAWCFQMLGVFLHIPIFLSYI